MRIVIGWEQRLWPMVGYWFALKFRMFENLIHHLTLSEYLVIASFQEYVRYSSSILFTISIGLNLDAIGI